MNDDGNGYVRELEKLNRDLLRQVAELEAELRKYEPSDGVMMQRLGDLQAIKEAARLIEKLDEVLLEASPMDRGLLWAEINTWLALPVVAQARKLP